jgi:Fuc2NAc and GlcNAc transferase
MDYWPIVIVACSSAAILTWLLLLTARKGILLDHPVARSAHSQPMPLGGGLAIVIPFYVLLAYSFFQHNISENVSMALAGGLALVITGLVDDVKNLSISSRLVIQIGAVAWVLIWLGIPATVQFFQWQLDIAAVIYFLTGLGFIWLINLFNFMDGIDGLAGSETCFVSLMSFLLVKNSSDYEVALLSLLLLALTVGFLIWNWPPAKIFMGDVGSGVLGFSLGVLAILSMLVGATTPWTWMLLLGVFIVDATYTLLRRIATGTKWYQGHNTHTYQLLTKKFGKHQIVTLGVLAINVPPRCFGTLFWDESGSG